MPFVRPTQRTSSEESKSSISVLKIVSKVRTRSLHRVNELPREHLTSTSLSLSLSLSLSRSRSSSGKAPGFASNSASGFPLENPRQQQETTAAMASKGRHSRFPSRKSPPSTLVFTILIMFTFLVLILLALGILSIPGSTSPDSPRAHDLSSIVHDTVDRSEEDDGEGNRWVEVISWEPRAFVYHNFLSKDECEYLINLGKPHMKKSTVVDSATGKSTDSRVRTSSGTFLTRGGDKIVQNIEKRIADFAFIPVEHGEGLQILHYEVGQKYEPHYDYFADEFNTKNGGQRIATVLMYLSDVEEGGETVFPAAKGNYSSVPWWNELSECGKGGLSLKPKRGDALLFWSMNPDGTSDPSSLHGGCPVIKGNKWSSTKWMRVNEYKV